MSQSSWQIGRPDLNAVFLNVFFFFFFFFPEQQTCQIWVGHSFEIWNLIFGWARYKTEHRVEEVCCSKCFIVFVISFLVYFDKKVHKKLKKKKKKIKQAKKISNLGFCWIKRAPKNKCARQLWDIWFIFFFSLIKRFFFSSNCKGIWCFFFWLFVCLSAYLFVCLLACLLACLFVLFCFKPSSS